MMEKGQAGLLSEPELKSWFAEKLSVDAWTSALSLEQEDSWVSDGPDTQFFHTLQSLAQHFEVKQGEAGIFVDDENMEDFVQILAYTRTTPSIRLLSLLGQCQPGLGGDVLKSCDSTRQTGHRIEAESKVVMARIKLLGRMEMYRIVFGPDRRKEVLRLLQEVQQIRGEEF
jgi:hypothetical protein